MSGDATTESLAGVRAIVITVSDSVFQGISRDESGPTACDVLEQMGAVTEEVRVVPDNIDQIQSALRNACQKAALVVTTGGTGVAPRDVTPEATAALAGRSVPGMGEAMRKASLEKTPHAVLSRAGGVVVDRSLILNLPGSPGGVRDCLDAVSGVLPHALRLIGGEPTSHLQS